MSKTKVCIVCYNEGKTNKAKLARQIVLFDNMLEQFFAGAADNGVRFKERFITARPWIGNVTGAFRIKFAKQVQVSVYCAQTSNVALVGSIHSNDIIPLGQIFCGKLPGELSGQRNPVFFRDASGTWIRQFSNMITRSACRVDDEVILNSFFSHQMPEYSFSQWRAAYIS